MGIPPVNYIIFLYYTPSRKKRKRVSCQNLWNVIRLWKERSVTMGKLLITGFDPFGGGTVNPSWEAVQSLPDRVGEWELCKLAIPTVFGTAAQLVLAKAEEFQPDVILCVGLAGGRDAVTPERIAVNIRDARIPDNAGNQPAGQFVDPMGPAAYFATVPVTEMAQAIRAAGIPATVSNSAGAFVCNDVLYTILNKYAGTAVRAGFIHVPRLPEQGEPSLPLEKTVAALIAAIGVL
jgi:pyroglutamyl-peptidase